MRTICSTVRRRAGQPLQAVGLSVGHDGHAIRGSNAERSFLLVYGRKGKIVARDCVNLTRDSVQGRKLVEAAAAPRQFFILQPKAKA